MREYAKIQTIKSKQKFSSIKVHWFMDKVLPYLTVLALLATLVFGLGWHAPWAASHRLMDRFASQVGLPVERVQTGSWFGLAGAEKPRVLETRVVDGDINTAIESVERALQGEGLSGLFGPHCTKTGSIAVPEQLFINCRMGWNTINVQFRPHNELAPTGGEMDQQIVPPDAVYVLWNISRYIGR